MAALGVGAHAVKWRKIKQFACLMPQWKEEAARSGAC